MILASAVAAGPIIAAPASPAQALQTTTGAENVVDRDNRQDIIDVFRFINEFRVSKGLKPVKFNMYLTELPQKWTNHMAANDVFGHNTGLFYNELDPRVRNYSGIGEIIGSGWDSNPRALVDRWIASPAHHQVMSDPDWTMVGIGMAYTDGNVVETPNRYAMYSTVNFFSAPYPFEGTYATPYDFYKGFPAETILVSPEVPFFSPNGGTYLVPDNRASSYTVNGVASAPGTYNAKPGVAYTLKATPKPGYAFAEGVQTTWTYTYEALAGLVRPPTFSNSTYTIPSAEGITYTVNGKATAAGIHPGTGTVTVEAAAKKGYIIPDDGQVTAWTHRFETPAVRVFAAAPVIDLQAKTYTIPSVKGIAYYVNHKLSSAGTFPGTGDVIVYAEALPGYTLSNAASWDFSFGEIIAPAPGPNGSSTCRLGDVNAKAPVNLSRASIKSGADNLAIDSAGRLWNYPASGTGHLKSRIKIGNSGWQNGKELFVADWNNDGVFDIVSTWKDGKLKVYKGRASGGFTSPTTIGSGGWQNMHITVGKYCDGLAYPQIVGKDGTGRLWLYKNESGSRLGSRVNIGSRGWRGFSKFTLIDWDRDGNQDLITKNSRNQLVLYRTNGDGKFINESRRILGNGWHTIRDINTVDNFTGNGSRGAIASDTQGKLRYYPLVNGNFQPAKIIGSSGWRSYNILR